MEGLTGNEVALAQKAAQINIGWWRDHGNGSDFEKQDIANLEALNKKLGRILDEAFPTDDEGEIDDSKSDDVLLTPVAE